MSVRVCFYCGKEIEPGSGRIFPLDRPRLNLWFHREICWGSVDEAYLEENKERIYKYADEYESPKTRKGKL